jgi:hypothetical protein
MRRKILRDELRPRALFMILCNVTTPGPPYAPISINVLLAQTQDAFTALPRTLSEEHLVIPGPREAAVRAYCKWQESRATDEAYEADFRRICQVILENRLDLKLILEDTDPGFFVQRGIKLGTARRFLRAINEWAFVTRQAMRYEQAAGEILDVPE